MTDVLTVAVLVAVAAVGYVAAFYRLRLSKAAARRNRTRAMWWRIRLCLHPGPGFTTAPDMLLRWSRIRAALGHGRRARPGTTWRQRLTSPPAGYCVPLGRAQWRKQVFGSLEDQTLVKAVPRSGKTAYLASRIIGHPGAVVATSTKEDLFRHTYPLRAQRGPVAVFNPQGIGGITSTIRWNMISGCEDPEAACRRAAALTGTRYEGAGDMAFWQSKAAVALAALINAAALDDRTIEDVFRWACKVGDQEAEDILKRQPQPGPLLATIRELRSNTKMADSVRGTMAVALSWVGVPALAEAAMPCAGEGFDVAEFVRDHGTLYMIGCGDDGTPIATVFRCLAEHVHYEAGLVASQRPGGRLDPPLLMALDEITQVCPVPLDRWVADSGGKGIVLVAVVHGRGQLEERWGQAAATTIEDCCGIKIVYGGGTDAKALEHLSDLFGSIPVKDREDSYRHVPVVPPELIRQLPDWWALVIRRNLPPLITRIQPVWKRRDVKQAARRPVQAPAPVQQPARAPLRPTIELPIADPELETAGDGHGNGHHPHGGNHAA